MKLVKGAPQGHCAEPKLFHAAKSINEPVEEMAIYWRGKDNSKYELAPGSPLMRPCATCQLNERIILDGATGAAPQ